MMGTRASTAGIIYEAESGRLFKGLRRRATLIALNAIYIVYILQVGDGSIPLRPETKRKATYIYIYFIYSNEKKTKILMN